jgi:lysine 2,3-aminomutase
MFGSMPCRGNGRAARVRPKDRTMNFVRALVQTLAAPGRRRRLRDAADLVEAGLLGADDAAAAQEAAALLPISITPHLASLIDPADAHDPIARQFVPSAAELRAGGGEIADPIGDRAHSPVDGIVHRYPDRVLLTPLMACPVYCRFCFRREAVGAGALTPAQLAAALAYIRDHGAIREVILSGGDPLALSPRRLRAIVEALGGIAHVETIRVHSRVPVADPDRVTPELIAALKSETPVWVVVHCNHPRELSNQARAAVRRLVDNGIPMLAQTVLLKGVNDDPATLEALMRALIRNRIKPYYLHHGDLARGTGHFRTSLAAGQALMRALRGRLSGIAQPTYVLDIPGGHGKVPVGVAYLAAGASRGTWTVEDWQGRHHIYRESQGDEAGV